MSFSRWSGGPISRRAEKILRGLGGKKRISARVCAFIKMPLYGIFYFFDTWYIKASFEFWILKNY